VLTTEVDHATVAQLHRKSDGLPEGIVTDHNGVVGEGVWLDTGSTAVVIQPSNRCKRGCQTLCDLSGLNEDHVVQATDFTEHEVAGSGVLRDLNELGPVTQ